MSDDVEVLQIIWRALCVILDPAARHRQGFIEVKGIWKKFIYHIVNSVKKKHFTNF